jgi:hypothetical protein
MKRSAATTVGAGGAAADRRALDCRLSDVPEPDAASIDRMTQQIRAAVR